MPSTDPEKRTDIYSPAKRSDSWTRTAEDPSIGDILDLVAQLLTQAHLQPRAWSPVKAFWTVG
jgi:hypothetical protein